MPNPRNGSGGGGSIISQIKQGRWDCNVCGTKENWATRPRCRVCTAYGPPRAFGGGGKGGGGNNVGGGQLGYRADGSHSNNLGGARPGGGAGGFSNNFAHRQIQREREDQRLQKQREEAKKREEALRLANQKLQRELAAARTANKPREADDEMDEDDDQEAEEDRQKKIEATQKAIPYLELQFGEESDQVTRAKQDIEDLQRASRDAKPYKTHRGQLERRLERLQRQQERAKEEEDEALIEVERAQERLTKLRNANAERERSIAAVDEELKDLLRKAISENDGGDQGPAPAESDPNAAWETISSTLASLAAQPGVPQDWASQLGGLLEQVRVAAMALSQHASVASSGQGARAQASQGATRSNGASSSSSSSSATSQSTPPPPSSAPIVTTPPPPAAAPAAASAAAALDSGLMANAADQSTSEWASRVHELAYTDGGGARGTGQAAGSPTAQTTTSGEPKGAEEISDSDRDSDDDDMASVVDADLGKKEDESAQQHKLRLARMLRERAIRKKAKQRERRTERKTKDGPKDGRDANGKERVNQKKK